MRKLLAGMATLLCFALIAAPASAKPKPPAASYDVIATIDCGKKPMVVGSGNDLWAPLVDLKTGRQFLPVAFNVVFEGEAIDLVNPDPPRGRQVVCSYEDPDVTGTVTLVKGRAHGRDR